MAGKPRPNFVLFMPDQLRADALGCMGNRLVPTPNFDAIAEQGIAFSNCHVQHTVCTPSRCSMFTGLYPHTAGHRSLYYLLHEHEPNLFMYLKRAGYHVEMIGKNDLLTAPAFAQSVTHRPKLTWDRPRNPWPPDHPLFHTFYFGRKPDDMGPDHDRVCIDAALEFLNSNPPEPFCLFLALNDPHPPYVIEEPYYSLVERDKVPAPAPPDHDGKARFMRILYDLYGTRHMTEEQIRDMIAIYWGMVARLDAMLGEILQCLARRGLESRTVVAVFSDHGDYCGDYGLTEKWWIGFQDCLTRVPLILRAPDMPARGTVNTLVEMLDIFATIMELAGVEPQHEHFSKSLLPLWSGAASSHRDAVFAEAGHRPDEPHCIEDQFPPDRLYYHKTRIQRDDPTLMAKSVMVRTDRYKYILRTADPDELYDLQSDPKELKNLADRPEYSATVSQLRDRILRWYVDTCDTVPLQRDKRDLD